MSYNQVAELLNNVTKEIGGEIPLVKEDLTNVVDVGKNITQSMIPNYMSSMVNHIGKQIFIARPYVGSAPSLLMDSWEFGAALMKTSCDLPEASENASWGNENTDFNPNEFYKPVLNIKIFDEQVTFEVHLSITEEQARKSLIGPAELSAFVSMIENSIEASMTQKADCLVQRALNSMIARTAIEERPYGHYENHNGVKLVNLANLHKSKLTDSDWQSNGEFLKACIRTIKSYSERMAGISTLFNIAGKQRYTPKTEQKLILHSDFASAIDSEVRADVKNVDLVTLPAHDVVSCWQGSGVAYDWEDSSKIYVKIGNDEVELKGICGVLCDKEAVSVCNDNRRTTTQYNPRGEFYNIFTKMDSHYLNDSNENFVVFYVDIPAASSLASVTDSHSNIKSLTPVPADGKMKLGDIASIELKAAGTVTCNGDSVELDENLKATFPVLGNIVVTAT